MHRHVAAQLRHNANPPCSARKLEFMLYTQDAAAANPQFELDCNIGHRMMIDDPSREAASCFYLLDIA